MSLEELSDEVAAARQHFEEGLIRAGFVEGHEGWVGAIEYGTRLARVLITLPSRFPFKPARVAPIDPDEVAWSWHRERDGALCLVADDDHENLWWAEADAFLAHVRSWFERNHDGWSEDRPDMDLDRYFERSVRDSRLYLFDDLDGVANKYVRFDRGTLNVMKLAAIVGKPGTGRGHSQSRYGFVIDAGMIAAPPREWSDVAALTAQSDVLETRIRDRSVEIVVIRYRRDTHDGAIVLEVWPNQAGGISARSLSAGADTRAARTARSGPDAANLTGKTVTIVGVGALGSFVADGLVRGGVTSLTLIDGDLLMPGNLVRHLAGSEFVGYKKAIAVQKLLERRYPNALNISTTDRSIAALDEAIEILEASDLVINATADFAITAMLNAAANASGKHLLSAAIQNDGETFRVDVLPPLNGATPLRSSARPSTRHPAEFYENGCGSPISPTPPAAVMEAAAATVRHAVGLLLNTPITPSGEIRDLSTNSDPESGE